MENNTNTWLSVYGRKINEILFQLEKHSMMNTAGGALNLKDIATFLIGAVNEIKKAQIENDTLKTKLVELIKKYNIKEE